jgi:hypothetical protein
MGGGRDGTGRGGNKCALKKHNCPHKGGTRKTGGKFLEPQQHKFFSLQLIFFASFFEIF